MGLFSSQEDASGGQIHDEVPVQAEKWYTDWCKDNLPDLSGKVIVITGSNTGLGFHTARALAAKGSEIVIACRTVSKGEKALAQLQKEYPDCKAKVMKLDLSSFASVRKFADEYMAQHKRLDVLVNNAGVMAFDPQLTEDKFDIQFHTNHLGHFLLTSLLWDMLDKTGTNEVPARVVNHASSAHKMVKTLELEDYNMQEAGKWARYGQSKLSNILFTKEMAKRLAAMNKSNVVTFAVHPGYASTELQQKSNFPLWKTANWLFSQSAQDGALPQIMACAGDMKKLGMTSGDYLGPDSYMGMTGPPGVVNNHLSSAANDAELAKGLWEKSLEWCKAKFPLPAPSEAKTGDDDKSEEVAIKAEEVVSGGTE